MSYRGESMHRAVLREWVHEEADEREAHRIRERATEVAEERKADERRKLQAKIRAQVEATRTESFRPEKPRSAPVPEVRMTMTEAVEKVAAETGTSIAFVERAARAMYLLREFPSQRGHAA